MQDFYCSRPGQQLSTLLSELEYLGVISQQELQRIGTPSSSDEWLRLIGEVNTKLDIWENNEGRLATERGETELARYVLTALTNEWVALFCGS